MSLSLTATMRLIEEFRQRGEDFCLVTRDPDGERDLDQGRARGS